MLNVFGAVTAEKIAVAGCAPACASPIPVGLTVFRGALTGRRQKATAMTRNLRLGAAAFAALVAAMGGCRQAAASPMNLTIDINGTSDTFTDTGTPNQIFIATYSVGLVTVTGEFAMEVVNGNDELTSSSFNITNNGSGVASVSAALSGQNFVGPVAVYNAAGSGTWANTPGSSMTESWYYDPTNTLGAHTATDTPGALLASLSSTPAVGSTDGFSFRASGYLPVPTGPGDDFSMTEAWSYTLDGDGGSLVSRGQSEIATVPEPATLGMFAVGMLGLTMLRHRMRRF